LDNGELNLEFECLFAFDIELEWHFPVVANKRSLRNLFVGRDRLVSNAEVTPFLPRPFAFVSKTHLELVERNAIVLQNCF